MKRIVECVPNFSEGRRPEVLDAIVAAILSVPNVYLLAREMDSDHNRAVVTIVGSPESIGMAAFRAVETAAKHIDLTKHGGEHPRMGATDVVPFVPIRGVTLEECVAIARQVGQRIADDLHIPVYLYEAAATRHERTNLENVRRGQFEGLREDIKKPERMPDFGKPEVHPTAGAIAVGARKPLIAYNINLNTADIKVARAIAKRIRHSSGGFRYVKALGIKLHDRNQAQVSMNLTDYEQTPMELVFETVKREAERFGVSIGSSEIVGLIPERALEQAAEFFLQIENFKPAIVLENRLAEAISGTMIPAGDSIRGFIDLVASPEPAPGGGSVAALAGSLGAALGQMGVRISQKKKAHQQYSERYADVLDRLAPYTSTLLELVEADADSYTQVLHAYRLPKDSPGRDDAIQQAIIRATDIPARTATCAAEALRLLEDIRPVIHASVKPDLEVGLQMLRTSLRSAIANIRTNLVDIKDPDTRIRYEDMITGWEHTLKG